MVNITRPDVEWLAKLVKLVDEIHQDYPELFNKEDEETLAINKELIRSIQ